MADMFEMYVWRMYANKDINGWNYWMASIFHYNWYTLHFEMFHILFFSWKNIFRPNLSNNEIKPKRSTYTGMECLLFLKYYLMKTYDVNGNCEIYN